MASELSDIFSNLKNLKKQFFNVDRHLEELYQEQYQEKVIEGYEQWRVSSEGRKFVKDQLIQLNYQCSVCRTKVDEYSITLDHIKPKSLYLGDSINFSNLIIMCYSCNRCKSNRSVQEWFSKLPKNWQSNFYQAIVKIHGIKKIVELGIKTK